MPTTVKQFRKAHPELKSKKIVLCQHLQDKSIEDVNMNLFLGDNIRVLLCPVCTKYVTQTAWEYIIKSCLMVVDTAKRMEYQAWLDTSGIVETTKK